MAHQRHRLVLDPEPGSVATGRRWAAHEAEEAHATVEAARTVELLTSEILTNAVVHTRAHRRIAVTTDCHDGCVRVEVTDPDPTLPLVKPGNARRLGGHGMRLVDALATAWGIDLHPGRGKTVWFETGTGEHGLTA
ncbi:ATP-binding protein [Cellulomonas hominis]|uniref:ATP-binding protein n=1 Tax=Cellulomonas hominis TaxID=156981 RepID=A0A7Z8K2U3_9CELL|nr:ATP-binding protein [Cellulomonas hominis]TKR27022.1 ATP-binding protein [Cellulomonas hominis]